MDVIKSAMDYLVDEDIPRDTPLESQMGEMERLRRQWEKMCSSADDGESGSGGACGDVFRFEIRVPAEWRWKAALLRSLDRKAFADGVRSAVTAYIDESFAEKAGVIRNKLGAG